MVQMPGRVGLVSKMFPTCQQKGDRYPDLVISLDLHSVKLLASDRSSSEAYYYLFTNNDQPNLKTYT